MRLLATTLCVLLFSQAIALAEPPPTVRVSFADGREIEGQLDDATDDDLLWLRRGEGRVLLSTSYRWGEVEKVEVDGNEVSPKELLADRDRYTVAWPEDFLFEEHLTDLPSNDVVGIAPEREQRAAACNFTATLANWDRDVEPDGYQIEVTVIDEHGYPMAVRGTLTAMLVGEWTDRRAAPFPPAVLERWSERVDTWQFDGGPAVFRLPFRQIRPEQQLSLAPGGILQVEIGAFGHGRFASSTEVALREFSPVRDRFEQRTDDRFFPSERHEHWHHW